VTNSPQAYETDGESPDGCAFITEETYGDFGWLDVVRFR